MANTQRSAATLAALAELTRLTYHHLLLENMGTDLFNVERNHRQECDDAMSELMSTEAQEQVLFMRQQHEEALTILDTMALELESKIAIHEEVLKGVRSMRAEVRRLKRVRVSSFEVYSRVRDVIMEEQLSRMEKMASRMDERTSSIEEILRIHRSQ
ncbi:uncharacterized protein H6S33_004898 [Morchella sextelata]|uniref:uncharacterized protein n=1 Tax=Morchella sextelata TaxID=1174677 RepID=UPI001D045765|nr:uncharacterized protein H6S33_004898 [Morchella sextelata]KAH0605676.1 hypothetical protein H6S33_004898 [Morchella sextelata]